MVRLQHVHEIVNEMCVSAWLLMLYNYCLTQILQWVLRMTTMVKGMFSSTMVPLQDSALRRLHKYVIKLARHSPSYS